MPYLKLWKTIGILVFLWALSGTRGVDLASNSNQKLLQTLHSYMNFQANPCQDFYQFACGNWENLLPQNADYLDTIGSLEYEMNRKLKQLLAQRAFKHKTKSNKIYYKISEYYKTCKEQQQFSAIEYLSIIKPTDLDEWPSVEDLWQPRASWNIFATLGRLQTVGFNGFLITLDMKNHNTTHHYLHLDKLQNLGFSSYEQKLLDEMDNSLVQKSRSVSQHIQNFINELANLHRNHKRNYGVKMSVQDLERQVPHIDFTTYFAAIVGDKYVQHLPLVVANLDYFRKLADLVQRTSSNTLMQVMQLKFLGYLEKQMPQSSSPLKCLQHMRDLVPTALDYIYEREIFQYKRNASEFVIQKLFKTMQTQFANVIDEHTHELSPAEVVFLKDKIFNMKLNIGNLPLTADEQYYQEYFASWQVYKGFFYWNHLNALQHQSSEKFNMLHLQWFSAPHTHFFWPFGSPAYQPSANLLIIPHTYLQYPIFLADFHEIFLYAELGNTLGHEMLHAFDTNGLQYDSQGNPSTVFINNLPNKKSFMASLECLNKQRPSSLNEKIADLSGFRLAYAAYFQSSNSPTVFSAQTYFNSKQLFFIKFAQFFCAVNPKRIHYDDSHDTPFERVPQVVTNHAEFAQVFSCPLTMGNLDQEKCHMW